MEWEKKNTSSYLGTPNNTYLKYNPKAKGMELQLSGKGVIKMKAIQCCYFLALVSSHLMAGVMGDDNIFLSNSDSAALYCVAKIFPDGENILIYKVNIINASSKKECFFFMKAQHQPQ